jgi:hypothetical protein
VSITRHTDSKGRLTLGPDYADRDVNILHEEGRVIIEPVVVIPEREAWLYRNPAALNAVRTGLAQARDGELVEPDLAEAFALADAIPDE